MENRVGKVDYPQTPNLLSSVFTYNGLRQRVGKQDSSGLSKYVMDGDSPGSDVLADGRAVYTPGLSERRGGATNFLKLDDAGNRRGQATAGFGSAAYRTADAFGNTVSQSGAISGPFGFEADAQYQTDNDSGLTLVGNRYYDAAVGRFIQPDPSGAEDNEYAYADNNPLSNDDPDGLQTVKPINGQQHRKLRRRKHGHKKDTTKNILDQMGKSINAIDKSMKEMDKSMDEDIKKIDDMRRRVAKAPKKEDSSHPPPVPSGFGSVWTGDHWIIAPIGSTVTLSDGTRVTVGPGNPPPPPTPTKTPDKTMPKPGKKK